MAKFSSLSCPAKFHWSMATNNPDSYQQKVTKFGKILTFVSDKAIILQEKCFVKFFTECAPIAYFVLLYITNTVYFVNGLKTAKNMLRFQKQCEKLTFALTCKKLWMRTAIFAENPNEIMA